MFEQLAQSSQQVDGLARAGGKRPSREPPDARGGNEAADGDVELVGLSTGQDPRIGRGPRHRRVAF
eukprot:8880728-Pyramimonas_sp.AAC.1